MQKPPKLSRHALLEKLYDNADSGNANGAVVTMRSQTAGSGAARQRFRGPVSLMFCRAVIFIALLSYKPASSAEKPRSACPSLQTDPAPGRLAECGTWAPASCPFIPLPVRECKGNVSATPFRPCRIAVRHFRKGRGPSVYMPQHPIVQLPNLRVSG